MRKSSICFTKSSLPSSCFNPARQQYLITLPTLKL
nr:MAG TPA: hypothetical protein [Caudoviricetes sp.]